MSFRYVVAGLDAKGNRKQLWPLLDPNTQRNKLVYCQMTSEEVILGFNIVIILTLIFILRTKNNTIQIDTNTKTRIETMLQKHH